jgi:poly(beta-D-mannuronate) lyase
MRGLVGLLVAVCGGATAVLAAEPLKAPAYFAPHRPIAARTAAPPCGTIPAPVRGLELTGFYRTDTAQQRQRYDEVDPAALERYRKQVEGLHAYQHELTKRVDQFERTGDPTVQRCAADWLAAWAASDAMLAPMNAQGRFEAKWHAASVCLSALKLGAPAAVAPSVRGYLVRLGQAAKDGNHADGPPSATDAIARNNHAYWAGLAAMACAIGGGERALFDWGAAQYRMAMADVTPEGFLPLEIGRGERALGYHAMSLDALVMIAELGEANGVRLYDEAGGAIHRLVDAVAKGFSDPAPFVAGSGKPQLDNAAFAKGYLSWAELYLARFGRTRPLPDLRRLVEAYRPLRHRWLGGEVTILVADAAR